MSCCSLVPPCGQCLICRIEAMSPQELLALSKALEASRRS